MKTLALVIGNNDYYQEFKLENAINDAKGVAEVFERLGYRVMLNINIREKDIEELLEKFEHRILNYDVTIFYFAGHGFEYKGENYLASIDCQIDHPNTHHCNHTCLKLSEILNILKRNSKKTNIVIIDACRKSFERGEMIGFSPIQASRGTLIAFSTSPGEGANDKGFGDHSVFTGALLQYIGRERLSVEELFKKVRKTVYSLTEGRKTTWEHSSLIGDFYFNTGQLVYSLKIQYDEKVVKDAEYDIHDYFGELINQVKTSNWTKQNPAFKTLFQIPAHKLNKNQQFILGRNILQASKYAFKAANFMRDIQSNVLKYSLNGENHLLNGILFEIYFNSQGEFRMDKTKQHFFKELMILRKNPIFKSSFDFISQLLIEQNYPLIYIPNSSEYIDIEIIATDKVKSSCNEEKQTFQEISRIIYNRTLALRLNQNNFN